MLVLSERCTAQWDAMVTEMEVEYGGCGAQDEVASVNVMVADVPGELGTVVLRVGDVRRGVDVREVTAALSKRTGLPMNTFRLRLGGRVMYDGGALVAAPRQRDAFVCLQLFRTLPGGKGGFGANLKGVKGGRSNGDVGACRDLSGRRIRDVEVERARMELKKRPRTESVEPVVEKDAGDAAADAQAEMDVEEVRVRLIETEQSVVDDVKIGLGVKGRSRKRRKSTEKKTVKIEDSNGATE